jgi:hypothetical protein
MVEFTTTGHFVAQTPVDAAGQGGAFGIALTFSGGQIHFAAVDDVLNTLDIWTLHFAAGPKVTQASTGGSGARSATGEPVDQLSSDLAALPFSLTSPQFMSTPLSMLLQGWSGLDAPAATRSGLLPGASAAELQNSGQVSSSAGQSDLGSHQEGLAAELERIDSGNVIGQALRDFAPGALTTPFTEELAGALAK